MDMIRRYGSNSVIRMIVRKNTVQIIKGKILGKVNLRLGKWYNLSEVKLDGFRKFSSITLRESEFNMIKTNRNISKYLMTHRSLILYFTLNNYYVVSFA